MEQLHIDLLRDLANPGVRENGLRVDDLLADMRCGRHRDLIKPDCERALRDLADKVFVHVITSLSGSKRWLLTSRGAEALKEEGL